MSNDFLNIKQAAAVLGVCPVTITRWCKAGRLTYYQIGTRKKFKTDDLQNYLEGGRRDATENTNPFSVD